MQELEKILEEINQEKLKHLIRQSDLTQISLLDGVLTNV